MLLVYVVLADHISSRKLPASSFCRVGEKKYLPQEVVIVGAFNELMGAKYNANSEQTFIEIPRGIQEFREILPSFPHS